MQILPLLPIPVRNLLLTFVRVMPGLPKAGVQSRIVLTPEHAKRLMYALQENVAKYERNFGPIRMPEEMNGGNNGPDGKHSFLL